MIWIVIHTMTVTSFLSATSDCTWIGDRVINWLIHERLSGSDWLRLRLRLRLKSRSFGKDSQSHSSTQSSKNCLVMTWSDFWHFGILAHQWDASSCMYSTSLYVRGLPISYLLLIHQPLPYLDLIQALPDWIESWCQSCMECISCISCIWRICYMFHLTQRIHQTQLNSFLNRSTPTPTPFTAGPLWMLGYAGHQVDWSSPT